MTLTELAEILDARIKYLTFLRTQSAAMGDLTQVAQFDSEIAETTTTKAQIDTLI